MESSSEQILLSEVLGVLGKSKILWHDRFVKLKSGVNESGIIEYFKEKEDELPVNVIDLDKYDSVEIDEKTGRPFSFKLYNSKDKSCREYTFAAGSAGGRGTWVDTLARRLHSAGHRRAYARARLCGVSAHLHLLHTTHTDETTLFGGDVRLNKAFYSCEERTIQFSQLNAKEKKTLLSVKNASRAWCCNSLTEPEYLSFYPSKAKMSESTLLLKINLREIKVVNYGDRKNTSYLVLKGNDHDVCFHVIRKERQYWEEALSHICTVLKAETEEAPDDDFSQTEFLAAATYSVPSGLSPSASAPSLSSQGGSTNAPQRAQLSQSFSHITPRPMLRLIPTNSTTPHDQNNAPPFGSQHEQSQQPFSFGFQPQQVQQQNQQQNPSASQSMPITPNFTSFSSFPLQQQQQMSVDLQQQQQQQQQQQNQSVNIMTKSMSLTGKQLPLELSFEAPRPNIENKPSDMHEESSTQASLFTVPQLFPLSRENSPVLPISVRRPYPPPANPPQLRKMVKHENSFQSFQQQQQQLGNSQQLNFSNSQQQSSLNQTSQVMPVQKKYPAPPRSPPKIALSKRVQEQKVPQMDSLSLREHHDINPQDPLVQQPSVTILQTNFKQQQQQQQQSQQQNSIKQEELKQSDEQKQSIMPDNFALENLLDKPSLPSSRPPPIVIPSSSSSVPPPLPRTQPPRLPLSTSCSCFPQFHQQRLQQTSDERKKHERFKSSGSADQQTDISSLLTQMPRIDRDDRLDF